MLKVQQRAIEKDIICSRPTSESCRYDLIIDTENGLQKAQVKFCNSTASHSTGSVLLKLKCTKGQGAARPYTSDEIDVLLVYIPVVDKICALPIKLIEHKSSLVLRYEKAKNGMTKNLHLIEDFIW